MRSSPSRLFIMLLLSLALGACAGDVPEIAADDGSDELASEAYAATTPTWINPECQPSGLSSPSGQCDGPWSFEWKTTCSDPAICGFSSTCAQYPSCSTWWNGIAMGTVDEVVGAVKTYTCVTKCPKGDEGQVECQQPICTGSVPGPTCAPVAAQRKNALLGSVPSYAPGRSYWSSVLVVQAQSYVLSEEETKTPRNPAPNKPYQISNKLTYQCQNHIVNYPSPAYGASSQCGACAAYQPNTCECSSGTTTTAPAVAKPTSAGPGKQFKTEPECTTCDEGVSFDPNTSNSGVMQCLWTQFHTAPAGSDIARSVAARIKLVYQLSGGTLDDIWNDLVTDAYRSAPTDGPACQEPVTFSSPECTKDAADAEFTWRAQECKDMVAGHVSIDTAKKVMSSCFEALAKVKNVDKQPCHDEMRNQASAATEDLITKIVPVFDASDGLQAELVEMLRYIDSWYNAAAQAAGDDESWLTSRSSAFMTRIWTRAHEAAQTLPIAVSTSTAAALALADISDVGLSVDYQMIEALFDSSRPIQSPPLLDLLADALAGTRDRLDRLVPIHDTACRFYGCAPTTPNGAPYGSPTAQAWTAIAAIGDPMLLATVVEGATQLSLQQPALYHALQSVSARHDVLASAYGAASRGEPADPEPGDVPLRMATSDEGPSHPPPLPVPSPDGGEVGELRDPAFTLRLPAVSLGQLLRGAGERASAYAKTGYFQVQRPRLSSAALKREQLVKFIDDAIGQVGTANQTYAAARLDLVNDLLSQIHATGETQSLLDRAVANVHQTRTLLTRLDGLRARQRMEQAAIGEFSASFQTYVESGAFDTEAAFQTDVLPQLEIRPADAHHPRGNSLDLVSDSAAKITLASGTALNIDMVDATWSPTCALSTSQVAAPDGAMQSIAIPDAVTGPEGYFITWTNTGYRASGWTNATQFTESSTKTYEDCGGFTATFPPAGTPLPLPFSVSSTSRQCTADSSGYSTSRGWSSSGGSDSRISASFNGGLRLPGVPVPFAPVGSLLAVTTIAGQPSSIFDIRVVGRRDVIVAPNIDPAITPDGVDVYFLVNDYAAGPNGVNCSPPLDSLRLNLTKVIPVGAVAKDVALAMAKSLDDIESHAGSILAQGGLGPQDASALRSGAWAVLTLTLAHDGHSLTGITPEMRNLFEAFIDKRIGSIGRRGEIYQTQLDIARIDQDMLTIEHELGFTKAASRLLDLIPRWRMRDLSGVKLGPAVSTLAEVLTSYAAPLFELRDPARLTGFRNLQQNALVTLLGMSFSAPYENTVDLLQQFASALRNSLSGAEFELQSVARRTIVIAFPRNDGSCEDLCDEFRQASREASEQVWAGITGPDHIAKLRITPADLYKAGGGNSQLACEDVAPVVRRASVYLVNPVHTSIDLAALGRELPAAAGAGDAPFVYPVVGKEINVSADEVGGVAMSLPVINGPGGDVLTDFGTSTELGAGAGISPFSTFTVNFNSFWSEPPKTFIGKTEAVLLVLEVERRVGTVPVFVPGACQAAVNP
jgi:hypothetical protein